MRYKIIRFDQSSGVFSDPLLFFYIDALFLGDPLFTQVGRFVYGHSAAEDPDQKPLAVHFLQIAADSRFRGMQKAGQLCERGAPVCIQNLQNLLSSLFGKHNDLLYLFMNLSLILLLFFPYLSPKSA